MLTRLSLGLALLFTLHCTCVRAQGSPDGATLTGVIFTADGEPAAFANVTLWADSLLVKATSVALDGGFRLPNVARGTYDLRVAAVGSVLYADDVTVGSTDLRLPPVHLTDDQVVLQTATVTARKPTVQVLPDKTVFNVDRTITAAGENAWTLLRKAPGVVVDNAGGIVLEGKTGVQFYVNGKETPLRGEDLRGYLESLQATDVASVELITQPSARYDAAGTAGIINIVLKRDERIGTNGSATASVTQGEFRRYGTGLSLNHRGTRGNIYGSYGGGYGNNGGFLYLRREQRGTEFDARTTSLRDYARHNARLNYDLTLNERSTLGAAVSTNYNDGDYRADTRTPIRPLGNPTAENVLVANNRTASSALNLTANLNYVYTDTSGTTLSADLDAGRFGSDRFLRQPNRFFTGDGTELLRETTNAQETPIDVELYAAKVDYEARLLGGQVRGGLKYSRVATDNNFRFFRLLNETMVADPARSNRFRYREDIAAAYASYAGEVGRVKYRLGLRAEHTSSDGRLTSAHATANDRVRRAYLDWFPSGGLTYAKDWKNQYALSFSRRITRPNYRSLNPFDMPLDELSSRRGNPFLQPQYANTLKLSHTYKYKLTTSLSYTRTTDVFAEVTEPVGENGNALITRNIANQETVNLSVSWPFSPFKWMNNYLSANAYVNSYAATNPEFVPLTQETFGFYARSSITLPHGFTGEVSGWYSSPSVWGGTYRTRSMGSLNLALERKVLADQLTVRVAVNDVLFTSPWEGVTEFGELFIEGTGGGDSRHVTLSLSYRFGNDKVEKARRRDSATRDERGRM